MCVPSPTRCRGVTSWHCGSSRSFCKSTQLVQKHQDVTIYDDDAVRSHGAQRGVQRGVQIDAPLLVVAIERYKAASDPQGLMKVLVSEWGLDPNWPFRAAVQRTVELPGPIAAR